LHGRIIAHTGGDGYTLAGTSGQIRVEIDVEKLVVVRWGWERSGKKKRRESGVFLGVLAERVSV